MTSFASRIWLAVQVGRTLVGFWPFRPEVKRWTQRYRVLVQVGIGMSDRP